MDIEGVRAVRDQIRGRVTGLMDSLDLSVIVRS
jgi:hypothetical protein